MNSFRGKTLSWTTSDRIVDVDLHHPPANEIGSQSLVDLETLAESLPALADCADVITIASSVPAGFSAGADLRELYQGIQSASSQERHAGVSDFLRRIHAVLNALDTCPLTTIAAVQGICFGGGFELALACDLIIADKMSRFCFPELRLGLIPGFGGIPRLKRDLGNSVVRDLLLTGRSINATRAHALGLVSQLAGEGQAHTAARATAQQITKFDPCTRATAKRFIKPLPAAELEEEITIFLDLLARPAVEAGLRRFVESSDPYPYLP